MEYGEASYPPLPSAVEVVSAYLGLGEPATVLTSCLFCPAVIETRTGLDGVAEMHDAGWEAVSGLDWCCPACSQARAEIVGDER